MPHSSLPNPRLEQINKLLTPYVQQAIRDEYPRQGFLHGDKLLHFIARQRAEETGLKDKHKKTVHEVFKEAFLPDRATGCIAAEWEPLFIDQIHEYASLNHVRAALIEVDITNVGGANKVLLHNHVTRAIAVITKIYEDELTNHGAREITKIRKGGDEFRFLVTGLSDQEIQVRLARAEEKIKKFSKDLGLYNLPHHKDPDDVHKSGFGAGSAFVLLNGSRENDRELQDRLEDGIKDVKEEIGREKFAESQKGALSSYEDYTQKDVGQILAEWEKDLHMTPSKVTFSWPQEMKLPRGPDRLDEGMYQQRVRAAESFAARQYFTQDQKDLLLSGVELANTRSPVTGLPSSRPLFDMDANRHLRQDYIIRGMSRVNDRRSDKERFDRDPPPMLFCFNLTNLAGLNNKYNQNGANAILKRVANVLERTIRDELGQKVAEHLYGMGGGKFFLLTHGVHPDKVKEAMDKVLVAVSEIKEIKESSDLKHPSYEEYGVKLNFGGVSLHNPYKPLSFYLDLAEFSSCCMARNKAATAQAVHELIKAPGSYWFVSEPNGNGTSHTVEMHGIPAIAAAKAEEYNIGGHEATSCLTISDGVKRETATNKWQKLVESQPNGTSRCC